MNFVFQMNSITMKSAVKRGGFETSNDKGHYDCLFIFLAVVGQPY